MADKTKSVVRIAGNEYTLSADTTEEYIHKVAIYVDRKMSQIQKARPELSTALVAVLAAVNITDELMELRGERETLPETPSPRQLHAEEPAQISMLTNITRMKDVKNG
ncbi:MAG: cell division protein ZapA [Eubacteriales bacterium]|nr:cell division protein ZapA [Eubacteriales bacterium]